MSVINGAYLTPFKSDNGILKSEGKLANHERPLHREFNWPKLTEEGLV